MSESALMMLIRSLKPGDPCRRSKLSWNIGGFHASDWPEDSHPLLFRIFIHEKSLTFVLGIPVVAIMLYQFFAVVLRRLRVT